MNLRPSGYEPDELPDCSTPHLTNGISYRQAGWLAMPKERGERSRLQQRSRAKLQ